MTKFLREATLLLLFIVLSTSCETEVRYPPQGYIPNTPIATETLEAQYFWVAQDKLNSPYSREASERCTM